MRDTTGHDAASLQPTGPGDLVAQLNKASARSGLWPLLAIGTLALVLITAAIPLISLALLLLGAFAVVWFALWERARQTVAAFYEVSGPTAEWYERLTSGYVTLNTLGGAWRITQSGAVDSTYQRKINSGASDLVARASVLFTLVPPRTLATNISVPSVVCGNETLLFLPDRILVRSGKRWSDLSYGDLRVSIEPKRFIESNAVPHDAQQVGITWQYVNVNGGPDRRFRNNRQLPILLYGQIELTSATGLRWILDCSRVDVATWLAAMVTRPSIYTEASIPTQSSVQTQLLQGTVGQAAVPTKQKVSSPPSRTSFAAPGRSGPLFAYADLFFNQPSLQTHSGSFAVIDVETTGFSPAIGDRIIEIAIARIDHTGRIEDEYATLLNPDGRDTGAVFVHGITNDVVRDAPRFADVVGDIVERLDGCVLVAHNAAFEEKFLAAEFSRCGLDIGLLPALCTLWLGRQTFRTPNHKLSTLTQSAGISLPDAHAALGDVRAVAALLPQMLGRFRETLGYPCAPIAAAAFELPAGSTVRPRTRAVGLRRGVDGWMSSILRRLPMSVADIGDAEAERYLESLSYALADGRIVAEEARALADLAGAAGFGSTQVVELNQRLLESMREAAFDDNVLTGTELRELRTAAKALGVPGYFDDLSAGDSNQDLGGQVVSKQRRCGNCRALGHYRSRCPKLVASSSPN